MSFRVLAVVLATAAASHATAAPPSGFECRPTCYPGTSLDCDGVELLCETSGNSFAYALNLVRYRMWEGIAALREHRERDCRAALQAGHDALAAARTLRDEQRRDGTWRNDVRYRLDDHPIDPAELSRRLETTDDQLAEVFHLCGGTAFEDHGGDALPLLRHPPIRLPPSKPRPTARTVHKTPPLDSGERKRLEALYDVLAGRAIALLHAVGRKPGDTFIGAMVEAMTVTAPPTIAQMNTDIARFGFDQHGMAQIEREHPDEAKELTERYVRAITPAVTEWAARIKALPQANAADCKRLERLIVALRHGNDMQRRGVAAFSEVAKTCDAYETAEMRRCREAASVDAYDRCVARANPEQP